VLLVACFSKNILQHLKNSTIKFRFLKKKKKKKNISEHPCNIMLVGESWGVAFFEKAWTSTDAPEGPNYKFDKDDMRLLAPSLLQGIHNGATMLGVSRGLHPLLVSLASARTRSSVHPRRTPFRGLCAGQLASSKKKEERQHRKALMRRAILVTSGQSRGELELFQSLLNNYHDSEFPFAVASEWGYGHGRGDLAFASKQVRYDTKHEACRVLVVDGSETPEFELWSLSKS
jgi:hypothetical protein